MDRTIPIVNDIVDIDYPGMFASADWRVICKDGENYYKSCGEIVLEKKDGSGTTCVKPIHHITWQHEDFDGRIGGVRTYGVLDIDTQTRGHARDILKNTGLNDEQIYNALNALFYSSINLVKESNGSSER